MTENEKLKSLTTYNSSLKKEILRSKSAEHSDVLYAENYKIHMEEIKGQLNKWRSTACSLT